MKRRCYVCKEEHEGHRYHFPGFLDVRTLAKRRKKEDAYYVVVRLPLCRKCAKKIQKQQDAQKAVTSKAATIGGRKPIFIGRRKA
jgi:hypothetical protein